ncbi:MAG: transaldolase [Bdellovibrionales bacterium]|nr:transaldolase [Bdellovibrionales bacterium]
MQDQYPQTQKRKYSIKIFSDGAERDSLLKMNKSQIVSGMTTNPSLMKKAGITDYRTFCKDILKDITAKPISFEVFADDFPTMEKQAREIATWSKNVYVKIPIINSEGKSSVELIRTLTKAGIKLNVTAIYTLKQTIATCQALEGGAPSIVSVFAGRGADMGHDPVPTLTAAAHICMEYGDQIECLWASTREVYNILQAEQCGCKIITVPFDVLAKLEGGFKTLHDLSADTVQTFKRDSEAAGFKL